MNAKLLEIQCRMHAVNAEVEGMKATNCQRAFIGCSMAYEDDSFIERAKELHALADEAGKLAGKDGANG